MVKSRQEITRIIRKYISNLEARGAPIKRVVLYGSYAHGGANEHSDIDIAVISPYFQGREILERQEFLGKCFDDIYEPLEPRAYTPEEYEEAEPGTMLYEIKSTGKILYEKKPRSVSDRYEH